MHTTILQSWVNFKEGHDKMQSGADLRGASPLVSFNHVTDPHFVTLFATVNLTLTLTLILTLTQILTLTLQ